MADLNEKQASLSVKVAGANSSGDETNFMDVDASGSGKVTLKDSAGTSIGSAIDVAGATNLLVSMTHNIFVSTKNSTTTNLAAGATFTGLSDNNLNATTIQVNVKADQPLTIQVQQSNDNTNWDFTDSYYLVANHDDSRIIVAAGSYVRVLVTNSGTATTTYLNLQTILVPIQAVLPRSLTEDGNLKISLEETSNNVNSILSADRAVNGAGIVATRLKRLTADFSNSLASNDVTSTVTSTGSVTVSNSVALISTGTGVTSSAKLNTNQSNKHFSGRETYFYFSARFTTPTSANSNQRIGGFDANNGTFVGYQGLTFGITIRKGGVDSFTAQTSFNNDLLNGNPNSNFRRNHVPETLDPTKLNTYRFRYGWSTGIAEFEILSPDGAWVSFHRFRFANQVTSPATLTASLPITAEVTKSAADATDLIIGTSVWDGGTVEDSNSYGIEERNGRKYITTNVVGQTTSQSVYTVSTGRILKVTSIILSVSNSSLVATGQLNIRDGNGGTILLPLTTPPSTNQANAGNNIQMTFPVPLRFSTALYAQVASGTLTYSVMFVGYESE